MRLKEISSTVLRGFNYLTGHDIFQEAQRNERVIVLEDTGKDYPEGVANLSLRGSMRIHAEWAKGFTKTMIIVPFRLSGIDAAIKLSRRLRHKPTTSV